MILAGLSCNIHNSRYRNIAFGGTDRIFPANAVLWSPAASVAEYRMRFEQPGGAGEAPLLDLAGTEAFLRDERRRRDELLDLLDRGGLVVVDLAGDARLRIHTVETIFELDLATGLPYPGAGRRMPDGALLTVTEAISGEPFRSFAAATGRQAGLPLSRFPGTALATAGGGEVLGFHAGIGTGHLIALPLDVAGAAPTQAAALLHAIGRLAASLGAVRHGALPPWVDRFLTADEQALRDDAQQLSAEISRLRKAQAALARQRERMRAGRALVFAGGRLLAEAAADAFRSSGAAVFQAREGEGDLVVERDGALHVVAIAEARAPDLAQEAARLAGFAEREGARAGRSAGAVLLLAGAQDLPPDERAAAPADPALLKSLAAQGVVLLTTLELFAMARAADAAALWPAWLATAPRPAGLPDWRDYLVEAGDGESGDGAANQSG